MKRIQAKKHKIGTYEINKISLSCLDDKRYVLDHGVQTLAYNMFNIYVQTFIKIVTNCKKEAIGTIYLFIYFIKIFCIKNTQSHLAFKVFVELWICRISCDSFTLKNTQGLFKYLNMPKKDNKVHKHLLYYA